MLCCGWKLSGGLLSVCESLVVVLCVWCVIGVVVGSWDCLGFGVVLLHRFVLCYELLFVLLGCCCDVVKCVVQWWMCVFLCRVVCCCGASVGVVVSVWVVWCRVHYNLGYCVALCYLMRYLVGCVVMFLEMFWCSVFVWVVFMLVC